MPDNSAVRFAGLWQSTCKQPIADQKVSGKPSARGQIVRKKEVLICLQKFRLILALSPCYGFGPTQSRYRKD
jgi:hypothetical protein